MARPTGRPPLSQRTTHNQQTESNASNLTGNSSPSCGTVTDEANMVALDSDMSLDNLLDSIGMWHSEFGLDDGTSTLVHSQPSSHCVSPSSTSHMHRPMESTTSQNLQFDSHNIQKPGQLDFGLPIRMDNFEIVLSNLYSELSSQLCSVRSAPWDVKGSLRLTFSEKSIEDGLDGSKPHPLVQLSKALADFESLLTALRPQQPAQRNSSAYSYPPPITPRLRTTQLLVVLSCYIHIVSIYDVIFSRVFDYLVSCSKASNAAQSAATPILYLGGLPVPSNQPLSGSLLVHLTEQQLHKIELLMGLPEHYCVSSRSKDMKQTGDLGLFGGHSSECLLNAVIQLGEEGHENYDDIRCVGSLKLTMRQIKDF